MYRARAKLEESFSELWSQQFDRGCTLNGGCDVVVKQLKPRSTLSCDGAKLPTRLKVKCAKCVKQADVIRISKHILLDECFPWGIYLNCAQNATSTHMPEEFDRSDRPRDRGDTRGRTAMTPGPAYHKLPLDICSRIPLRIADFGCRTVHVREHESDLQLRQQQQNSR